MRWTHQQMAEPEPNHRNDELQFPGGMLKCVRISQTHDYISTSLRSIDIAHTGISHAHVHQLACKKTSIENNSKSANKAGDQ